MKRGLKQFLYGLFYLVVFGLIIFGVYSVWFKPAPSCFNGVKDTNEQGIDCGGVCSKVCSPSSLGGIQVSGLTQVFHPTPSTVSVMVRVQNPNSDLSARKFFYKFTFRDAQGNAIAGDEINGDSFIYGSEIKYIAEFNSYFADAAQIDSANFSMVGDPEWISGTIFTKPKLILQNLTTSVSGDKTQAKGTLVNNDTITVAHTVVLAVFYSKLGQSVGISKTEVDNIEPGQQQTFSIDHPLLGNIDPEATKIYLYGD